MTKGDKLPFARPPAVEFASVPAIMSNHACEKAVALFCQRGADGLPSGAAQLRLLHLPCTAEAVRKGPRAGKSAQACDGTKDDPPCDEQDASPTAAGHNTTRLSGAKGTSSPPSVTAEALPPQGYGHAQLVIENASVQR